MKRELVSAEIVPPTGKPPVCAFDKKHPAQLEATEAMRPPWYTCQDCFDNGLKAVGLNTDFVGAANILR